MSSAGGLTRRRGGGGGGGATTGDEENEGSRSVTPAGAPRENGRAAETSYTGGENGHKIAFDPRDMADNEERSKQPKLTLMEEVLLMGLKDKQVESKLSSSRLNYCFNISSLVHRDIFRFGTTTYLTRYGVALSLS